MLGDFAMLMSLQSARVLLSAVGGLLVSLEPTAQALRHKGFPEAVAHAKWQTKRQTDWIDGQLTVRAPQVCPAIISWIFP